MLVYVPSCARLASFERPPAPFRPQPDVNGHLEVEEREARVGNCFERGGSGFWQGRSDGHVFLGQKDEGYVGRRRGKEIGYSQLQHVQLDKCVTLCWRVEQNKLVHTVNILQYYIILTVQTVADADAAVCHFEVKFIQTSPERVKQQCDNIRMCKIIH